jgi:hypothetical protein
LQPGDTLLVRGGTYHDPGGYDWATTASGTASAPITVKAYPGETSVFDGGASAPATGDNSHPQQALILKGVAYVTFEDLNFTHYDPWDNGILIIDGSAHITFRRIHSYANYTATTTEHDFYLVASNSILIDDCTLDGIAGSSVQIHDGSGTSSVGSSNVIVQNSRMTGPGAWGIEAGTNLAGAMFSGNTISGRSGFHFYSNTTNVSISGNIIGGSVGIWTEVLSTYGPATETNDCIDSSTPFKVGWPGVAWTLAQWQASGRGVGTTAGACP